VATVTRVVGDARLALAGILERVRRAQRTGDPAWVERVKEFQYDWDSEAERHNGYLRAPKVVRALREALPRDAVVTTEVGQNQMWAALHFQAYEPRTFHSSGGLGTMGWGFPAAIGAKAAKPQVPVVDIAGDGSFGMTENNLATAVEEELPVIVVVLNNNLLGMVMEADVPTVIDVPIDPKENVMPMIPPGMGLKDTLWEAD